MKDTRNHWQRSTYRSALIAVEVVEIPGRPVTVNVFQNHTPLRSFPVEGALNIGQALILVGTQMTLEGGAT